MEVIKSIPLSVLVFLLSDLTHTVCSLYLECIPRNTNAYRNHI